MLKINLGHSSTLVLYTMQVGTGLEPPGGKRTFMTLTQGR